MAKILFLAAQTHSHLCCCQTLLRIYWVPAGGTAHLEELMGDYPQALGE